MSKSKLLVIAGIFDENGGATSPFAEMFVECSKTFFNIRGRNGGNLEVLDRVISNVCHFDVVVWIAQVDDPGYLLRIKEANPKCLLVQAVRNDKIKHSLCEIVSGMLKTRSHLSLVIDRGADQLDLKIIDSLGNLWYEGPSVSEVIVRLQWYINYVAELTRVGSTRSDFFDGEMVIEEDFWKIVRLFGAIFKTAFRKTANAECIAGDETIRCIYGYPSICTDNAIIVSRRDIDENGIEKEMFVAVENRTDTLSYSGGYKPSVDTPLHLQIYNYYKDIRYIIHGHCYVENAPTTSMHVPCGYLEEINEIKKIYPNDHYTDFAINLLGHGCIICAGDLGYFTQCRVVSRDFPERMKDDCIDYLRNWKHG